MADCRSFLVNVSSKNLLCVRGVVSQSQRALVSFGSFHSLIQIEVSTGDSTEQKCDGQQEANCDDHSPRYRQRRSGKSTSTNSARRVSSGTDNFAGRADYRG